MTADSVSSEYTAKPPVWLVDHLEQWRQRRASGRAGHALIVTSEDVEEASLFCHLLAAKSFVLKPQVVLRVVNAQVAELLVRVCTGIFA